MFMVFRTTPKKCRVRHFLVYTNISVRTTQKWNCEHPPVTEKVSCTTVSADSYDTNKVSLLKEVRHLRTTLFSVRTTLSNFQKVIGYRLFLRIPQIGQRDIAISQIGPLTAFRNTKSPRVDAVSMQRSHFLGRHLCACHRRCSHLFLVSLGRCHWFDTPKWRTTCRTSLFRVKRHSADSVLRKTMNMP